jgi:hypothetical protein
MLTFLGVFGVGLAATLLVRWADIECVNPPKRREPVSVRASKSISFNRGAVIPAE